jgi:hypothetical protein
MKKNIYFLSLLIFLSFFSFSCAGGKSIKYPQNIKNKTIEATLWVQTKNMKIVEHTGFNIKCMKTLNTSKLLIKELNIQLPDIANRVKVKIIDNALSNSNLEDVKANVKTKYIFSFITTKWNVDFSITHGLPMANHDLDYVASIIEVKTGKVIWMKSLKTSEGSFNFNFFGLPSGADSAYSCKAGFTGIIKKHIRSIVEDIQK